MVQELVIRLTPWQLGVLTAVCLIGAISPTTLNFIQPFVQQAGSKQLLWSHISATLLMLSSVQNSFAVVDGWSIADSWVTLICQYNQNVIDGQNYTLNCAPPLQGIWKLSVCDSFIDCSLLTSNLETKFLSGAYRRRRFQKTLDIPM